MADILMGTFGHKEHKGLRNGHEENGILMKHKTHPENKFSYKAGRVA